MHWDPQRGTELLQEFRVLRESQPKPSSPGLILHEAKRPPPPTFMHEMFSGVSAAGDFDLGEGMRPANSHRRSGTSRTLMTLHKFVGSPNTSWVSGFLQLNFCKIQLQCM